MKPRHVTLLLLTAMGLLGATTVWLKMIHNPPPARPAIVRRAAVPPPLQPTRAAPEKSRNLADTDAKPGAKRERGAPVVHEPAQPKTGQSVLVSVDFTGRPAPVEPLVLEYQVVEPGRYIALKDAAFQTGWVALAMNDQGEKGDKAAGDQVFSVQLPPEVQKHRRLVRYRIRATGQGKVVAPDPTDPQPNLAYFVYDGVPPWKGAVNPKSGDPKVRELVTYPSEALQRVPVYHFISSQQAVERAMWSDPEDFGTSSRNEYRYTGTMVYDGVVYDHIGFRARGGSWRHAMGKNMWKFNFLPGHRFEARDDYGRKYHTKWDKLNLGACIQQADYGMRGEQGMFEAVGFRLFNLAGIEASLTHWIHLRVIDQPEESPSNQYAGDFWGLYLAVENLDEHFLKEHQLPAGNLYKMEFGSAKTAFNGEPKVNNQADVREFQSRTMRRQQPDSWWRENLDLARYYNYRAILECIHHYDVDAGKNYFYYRNPTSSKWIVLPWDIDLSWGDNMYGGGYEPFFRAGLLSRSPFRQDYQARLAEVRDLLFNPEQIGLLIDEHAAMISGPDGKPSLVDADRAKWDYHPILASQYVLSMKAGQGRFYFGNPRNTFATMVTYMKKFAARRAVWVDRHLLAGYNPPEAPQVAPRAINDLSASTLPMGLASSTDALKSCRWRLAEVTRPNDPAFDPNEPWKYEIQALWEKEAAPNEKVEMPTSLLKPGHTYRIRARGEHASEGWSRWSAPVEFTVKR
ncbi:MAG: CotH kinase family protein [Verrucomicrobiota bacterium]